MPPISITAARSLEIQRQRGWCRPARTASEAERLSGEHQDLWGGGKPTSLLGKFDRGGSGRYAHLDRIVSAVTAPLASTPILAQVAIILFLTDLLQYWGHRLFHQNPLWRFHCIHHAPTRVDWLTSARIHPVNVVLYSTLINLLISLLGFSSKAFFFLVPFNTLFAFLVHANLNWTFGPFRYAIASPVFHRWHHTYADQGGNKNFAPNFPLLDLAFGTFYMPKGQLPFIFGTPDNNVPNHLLRQLRYPFERQEPTP